MKHTLTLEIAGTKVKLVADADAQHLSQLASIVNERVKKLEQGGKPARPNATAAQLLALVALGLADDLVTSRKQLNEMEQLTRRTIQSLISRIDKRLESESTPQEQLTLPEAQ